MAEQLSRTLAETVSKAAQATRPTPQTVAKPVDKSGNFADRIFSDPVETQSRVVIALNAKRLLNKLGGLIAVV